MNKLRKVLFSFFLCILFYTICGRLSILYAANTSLNFSPNEISYEAESRKSVNIVLKTGVEKIVGVDLIIEYDSKALEVSAIGDLGIFSYKAKEIIDNGAGTIKLGFSNDYGKTFSGTANIATIYFRQKEMSNDTNMRFLFSMGKTNDTNIVNLEGEDVLTSVGNLVINLPKTSQASVSSTKSPPILGRNKKSEKETLEKLIEPQDSNFVFPNKIISDPQVLGEENIQNIPQVKPQDNLVFLVILGALTLIFLVAAFFFFLFRRDEGIISAS